MEPEEGFLHSEADPEVTIIQEGHANTKNIYYKDRGDSRQQGLRSQSRLPAEIPRVASRSPGRDKGRCFSCTQFVHFIKESPERDTSASNLQHTEKKNFQTQSMSLAL